MRQTSGRTCNHATCDGPCRRPAIKPKPRTPVRPVSNKRQKESRTYSALRKQFLADNPNCKAILDGCMKTATQVHHKRGRVGENYLDVSTWLPVCHSCHETIERNPVLAKKLGLSESRLINQ